MMGSGYGWSAGVGFISSSCANEMHQLTPYRLVGKRWNLASRPSPSARNGPALSAFLTRDGLNQGRNHSNHSKGTNHSG